MDGRPVWLASISHRRPTGRPLYVPEWNAAQRRIAEQRLRQAVDGVGDPTRERLFRMNVTLCLHRAATDDDLAAVAPWFLEAPGIGLAGGPVAILSETIAGRASTRPCERPGRRIFDRASPYGWIPIDCGACEPCRARGRIGERTP